MSNSVSNLSVCGCCGNKNASPSIDNVQGLSALRYRIGTYESFKKGMLDAISDADALSKLTTRYDDDLAMATLDAWATVLDVLTFYQERICNEGYLRTAVERLSVVCLANHISYKPLPGLAAATYLAFSMNEAQGAPPTAVVPAGTKVQSIPKQSQLPQVFETIEQIEARVEWNKIKPQTTTIKMPRPGDTEIYLDGIQTGLQLGDRVLIVSAEHGSSSTGEEWDFRRILALAINTNNGYTKITLDRALGLTIKGKSVSETIPFKVFAMRQKANLFGYNAPDFKSMSGSIRAEFLSQGLSASYFTGISFNTFAGSGVDSVIDFTVTNPTTTTFPLGLNNNFSIRWSGFILPAVTGNITFNLSGADDGVRLWIDNKLIIDNWGLGGGTGAIPLQSGQLYPIILDYFQANIPGANPARVQLQWSGPGLANEIIPANYLFYSNGNPTEWPGYTISTISSPNAQTIYLDALYPKILTGGWL
ncbi:MAG: hypothetical protein JWO06_1827, partial [Bacteroidota bacterium]|nr:hypothetical protein [Bacteroidota bacterium]